MKRPVFYVLLVSIAGLVLVYTSFRLSIIVAVLVLAFFECNLQNNRQKILMSSFFLILILYFFLFNNLYNYEKSNTLDGLKINAYVYDVLPYGVILNDISISYDSQKKLSQPFLIKCINGEKRYFPILIYTNQKLEIGDFVNISLNTQIKKEYYNRGRFDFDRYLMSKMISNTYSSKIISSKNTKKYALKKILHSYRIDLSNKISSNMPKHAELLSSIILGTNSDFDLYNIKGLGLIHIFAISGLHLAIIVKIFHYLSMIFTYKKERRALISSAFVILYTMLTGLHISTIRAGIMILIFLLKDVFLRAYDRTSALGIAFIFMIFINPFSLYNIGFLLSFFAVIGIFYISEGLPFKKSQHKILSSLNIILAVYLGISPILVYFFYSLSTYSIFANFIVIPLMPIIIFTGVFSTIIPNFLAKYVLLISSFLIDFIIKFSDFMMSLPYSEINVGKISVLTLILFLAMLFSLKKNRLYFLITFSALVTVFIVSSFRTNFEINFLDIGNGDAIVIRDRGEVMLIDGGGIPFKMGENQGINVLLPFLKHEGINDIDKVVISHSDFDHIYGMTNFKSFCFSKKSLNTA